CYTAVLCYLFFHLLLSASLSILFPYTTLFRSRLDSFGSLGSFGSLAAFLDSPGRYSSCSATANAFSRPTMSSPGRRISNVSASRSEEHTSELQSRFHLV